MWNSLTLNQKADLQPYKLFLRVWVGRDMISIPAFIDKTKFDNHEKISYHSKVLVKDKNWHQACSNYKFY